MAVSAAECESELLIILTQTKINEKIFYITWSIAHGMRHSTSLHPLKMCGKLEENEGQACTGGKLTCPRI